MRAMEAAAQRAARARAAAWRTVLTPAPALVGWAAFACSGLLAAASTWIPHGAGPLPERVDAGEHRLPSR